MTRNLPFVNLKKYFYVTFYQSLNFGAVVTAVVSISGKVLVLMQLVFRNSD
jgi:hypothetical protein